MKRRFNTAGPCVPAMHYTIPAERRLPQAPRARPRDSVRPTRRAPHPEARAEEDA